MKQRILIVGAGFAGMWSALSAVRQLDRQGRDDVEVAVLAPQPELRIRPRFYEPDVQRMAAPLGELFAASACVSCRAARSASTWPASGWSTAMPRARWRNWTTTAWCWRPAAACGVRRVSSASTLPSMSTSWKTPCA